MNEAIPVFEYAFVLDKSLFHVELQLDDSNRIVKSGFYLASPQEENDLRKYLKNS